MRYAEPWEHPNAVATPFIVIFLSTRINSSIRCTFVSATWSSIICDFRTSLREFLNPVVNRFTRQTLPTVCRKHFFMNILCIKSFYPQKPRNRMLPFDSTLLKHCRYFDYWNQPLIMRMRVYYLDCYEAGLCCYLVIHTENLLHQLQLFYFHLWPIYWLSLVTNDNIKFIVSLTKTCFDISIILEWFYEHVYSYWTAAKMDPFSQ
jgi:hypothetical protein